MYIIFDMIFNENLYFAGETFVTRKITRAVAKIILGQQEKVELGNLDSKRDWGHANDYIEVIHEITPTLPHFLGMVSDGLYVHFNVFQFSCSRVMRLYPMKNSLL